MKRASNGQSGPISSRCDMLLSDLPIVLPVRRPMAIRCRKLGADRTMLPTFTAEKCFVEGGLVTDAFLARSSMLAKSSEYMLPPIVLLVWPSCLSSVFFLGKTYPPNGPKPPTSINAIGGFAMKRTDLLSAVVPHARVRCRRQWRRVRPRQKHQLTSRRLRKPPEMQQRGWRRWMHP